MQIVVGEVIPGVAIGKYHIGMKMKDLLKEIGNDYIYHGLGFGKCKIILENALIWIDENQLIEEVGVSKGFQSAYQDHIRIGTTLKEIKEIYGGYEEGYDTYNLIGVDGMCFELEDGNDIPEDEWDELKLPIEWIFVYKI